MDILIKQELRPCKVGSLKALFHRWIEESDVIEPSLMIGGHPGGVVRMTFGIVEFEDGSIGKHSPYEIKFIDNNFNDWDFGVAEKVNMDEIRYPNKILNVDKAFSTLEKNGKKNIVLRDLANVMNITPNTVRKKIKEQGGFEIINQGLGNPSIVKRIK